VTTAGQTLIENSRRSAVVLDGTDHLTGIVTLRDINRVISRWQQAQAKVTTLTSGNATEPDTLVPNFNWRELPEFAAVLAQTVGEIATKDLLVAYTDESLSDAIERMALRDLRQLPVVSRSDEKLVVGLLTRELIDHACRLALTRELLKPFLVMTQRQN
jgi:CBS domain-containing protein